MSTYRERRERRAEQLQEWSEKRERDASAVLQSHERFRGDHAFNSQPGHIPQRAKVIAQADRAHESLSKAEEMGSRAEEIERQLASSIYDDDPDAIERLEEKLAAMERRRDAIKAKRAEIRKTHRAELKGLTAWEKEEAMRAAGAPQYSVTNLTGNITRTRDRLARLKREKEHGPRDRMITARFTSSCADCGAELVKGELIRYNRQEGARCYPACGGEG